MRIQRFFWVPLLLLAVVGLSTTGCFVSSRDIVEADESENKDEAETDDDSSETDTTETDDTTEPETDTTEDSAEPIDVPEAELPTGPFNPPETLADLNKDGKWIEQPTLSAMKLLEEKLAKINDPIAADKALAMKNKSNADNEKMLNSLGQLPAMKDEVDYEATFTRHAAGDVKSVNPIMGSSLVEFEVLDLTGFAPFAFDWNFTPFANSDTVVSWHVSEDRLLDKIVLRDDLVWSDGKPITAYDIEFSYNTIMDERIQVPAVRSGTDELWGVKAYDEHTLVYFHKKQLATNVWNINFPTLPMHIFKDSIADDPTLQTSEYHAKFENEPVAGGPYIVTKRNKQDIVLKRRENWYMVDGKEVRDKPFLKEFRFKIIPDPSTSLLAIKNGELEEITLTAQQWVTQTDGDDFYEKNTKVMGLEWSYSYIGWNNESKFFNDKRVRQAMSYSLDYEELIEQLRYGLYQQSNGVFHPQSWMAPKGADAPKLYEQDLDKAEELLDEAGWEDSDGDGIRDKEIDGKLTKFEFTIICSPRPTSIEVCELLKSNLDQIGVICNVKSTEFTVLQELNRTHKFDATLGGWGTGADPDTSKNLWKTGEGRNYTNYSNKRVDELFEQGAKEFDRKKRGKIYAEIHKQLFEDQPYTWLYYASGFYGYNKKMRGYNMSPRGPLGYSPGPASIWAPVTN